MLELDYRCILSDKYLPVYTIVHCAELTKRQIVPNQNTHCSNTHSLIPRASVQAKTPMYILIRRRNFTILECMYRTSP
jgi:hypothetical protein